MSDHIEAGLKKIASQYTEQQIWHFANTFSKQGMIVLKDIVPKELLNAVKHEALTLLDQFKERVDLRLKTTDNTPRKMTIVSHTHMLEHANVIKRVYESPQLKNVLQKIARDELINYISDDEGLFLARQEYAGDTHGWHWGDYNYALIWVLETPPIEVGGMLQCVPHTRWDKQNPRIHQYLCDNQIDTYGFTSGDIYFLKTDTTLHRTVPLEKDATRIILNLTWGGSLDRQRPTQADAVQDTWWQDSQVEAVTAL